MKCPRCQQENPPQAKFCLECGIPFGPTNWSDAASVVPDESQRRLDETLQQQAATSEVLQIISRSPGGNVQPVFDLIAERAAKLCGADLSIVTTVDGGIINVAAIHGVTREAVDAVKQIFPMPSEAETITGRVVRAGATVHVPDVLEDARYEYKHTARASGQRSCLGVPMIRDRAVIGVIFVARRTPGYFSESQVALLRIFADQAVIAINNVQLVNEAKERLQQQTAAAEILRVISSSPTSVKPVLDTIVQSAVRLCAGFYSLMFLSDGDRLELVATHNVPAEGIRALEERYPLPIASEKADQRLTARAMSERRVIHVADMQSEANTSVASRLAAQAIGHRAVVAVPMLREAEAIGVLIVSRREAKSFVEKEIAILRTFADQAVIAIENVRLFNETKKALERQTASSEILRIISSSPTDVQPVFETIIRNAVRLSGAAWAIVTRVEAGFVHLAAHHLNAEVLDRFRLIWPHPVGGLGPTSRVVRTGQVFRATDIEVEDCGLSAEALADLRARGIHSMLVVPMVREGSVVGTINLTHQAVGAFLDAHVALITNFADQAVIAIENVRLFKETKEALEQQMATGEVLRVIASSPADVQPVFETITDSAMRLFNAWAAAVFRYEGQLISMATARGGLPGSAEAVMARLQVPHPPTDERPEGRTALTRTIQHVVDVDSDMSWGPRYREDAKTRGFRSYVAVPMVRGDVVVGVITVSRQRAGGFATGEISLLQTFADQAVIAIENVRLFKELQGANRELSVASQHKSEFLANMSHELRTPLNAILGFSEVLGERMFGDLNEKQEEYLKDIHASGQHLLSLINDILDLSKIEAGRMELELMDFDLPTAIENALTLVRERAARRGIALRHATDQRLGRIRADERKIKQVLLNILSNALKFTPEGGRIEVRARLTDSMAEISVTDTGVGIAPEDQEAIFEEFRQVGTTAKTVEGTGLGLTLSRKFIELHGGRIWVESQLGMGSTFTFTLPIRPEG